MKKIITLTIVAILMILPMMTLVSEAADTTVSIQFVDNNMYKKVVEVLGAKIESKNDSTNTIVMTEKNKDLVVALNLNNAESLDTNKIAKINGIEKFTKLQILYLNGNKISDISLLSNLTQLTFLKLDQNEIVNIDGIKGLIKLETLTMDENKISDINSVKNLINLEWFSADTNEIIDISPISNLTKLETLVIYRNKIVNVSALKNLKNLTGLYIYRNEIVDITPIKDLTKLETLYIFNNKITDITPLKNLVNLKTLEFLNNPIEGIAGIPTYSTKKEGSESVTVTIVANDKLKPLSGWLLSDDKLSMSKVYTKNTATTGENITITDLEDNTAVVNVKVLNIGKDIYAPIGVVTYSRTEPVNGTVTVTITANEELQEVADWTLSTNKLKLTKIYTSNTAASGENITIKDLAGNSTVVNVKVLNIDKKAPEIQVEFSTTSVTTGTVTVTITANEKVQEVAGWTLSADKLKLTKVYTSNTTATGENVTIKDLAGNSTTVNIKVLNINKESTKVNKGDIDGNGKVDVVDLLAVKRHILSTNKPEWKLTGDRFTAGDTNGDGKIDVVDLLAVKRMVLKNTTY